MSNRTRNRRRQPRNVATAKRIEPMIDADPSLCLEDPATMADYQDHDRLCDDLADCLARSDFADLTTEDGQPIGEEVLTGLGWDSKRKAVRDLLADRRFTITRTDAG